MFGWIWREAIEFAPSVSTSRKAKNNTRGGNDQSGSQPARCSVVQLMTGSALPSRAMSTTITAAESTAPIATERVREDEKERGVAVASYAVPPMTRTGASTGTATRSFAESSDQFTTPRVIMA